MTKDNRGYLRTTLQTKNIRLEDYYQYRTSHLENCYYVKIEPPQCKLIRDKYFSKRILSIGLTKLKKTHYFVQNSISRRKEHLFRLRILRMCRTTHIGPYTKNCLKTEFLHVLGTCKTRVFGKILRYGFLNKRDHVLNFSKLSLLVT